ncbi:hypothetical protein ACFZDG_33525 [Kitasatospora xanthocidica]|uniref:hypothetical protein n=1 Tax=Kitasatospora xanthocidica TaxID=83382 RepID=UPI0036EEE3A6
MAVIKIEIDGGVLTVEIDDADLERASEVLGTSSLDDTIKAAVADVARRSKAQAAYDDISRMVESGDVDLGSLLEEDQDDADGDDEASADLAERIRSMRRAAQGKARAEFDPVPADESFVVYFAGHSASNDIEMWVPEAPKRLRTAWHQSTSGKSETVTAYTARRLRPTFIEVKNEHLPDLAWNEGEAESSA